MLPELLAKTSGEEVSGEPIPRSALLGFYA